MIKSMLYGGEVELIFDDVKHTYFVGGVAADGVTSILKVINKPALIPWALKMAGEYLDANMILGEPIDEVSKKKLIDGAKKAHKIKFDDAGDLGTMFHELVEKHVKKLPYEMPVNEILKRSFNQFLEWARDNKVVFKSSERKIYSRKHNYAGTIDITGTMNGENVLFDVKTSSGIWNEYWFQVAAYLMALREEYPEIDARKMVIIRCGKDGTFEVQESDELEENFKAFIAALTLHRRLKVM